MFSCIGTELLRSLQPIRHVTILHHSSAHARLLRSNCAKSSGTREVEPHILDLSISTTIVATTRLSPDSCLSTYASRRHVKTLKLQRQDWPTNLDAVRSPMKYSSCAKDSSFVYAFDVYLHPSISRCYVSLYLSPHTLTGWLRTSVTVARFSVSTVSILYTRSFA